MFSFTLAESDQCQHVVKSQNIATTIAVSQPSIVLERSSGNAHPTQK